MGGVVTPLSGTSIDHEVAVFEVYHEHASLAQASCSCGWESEVMDDGDARDAGAQHRRDMRPEPMHLTITDRDNDAVKFRPGYATGSIALVVNTIHEGRPDPTRVVLREADLVRLRDYLDEVLDA